MAKHKALPTAPVSALAARKARTAAAEEAAASATPTSDVKTKSRSTPSASSKKDPFQAGLSGSSRKVTSVGTPSSSSKKTAPSPPSRTPVTRRRASTSTRGVIAVSSTPKTATSGPSTPNKLFLTGQDPLVVISASPPLSRATPATNSSKKATKAATTPRSATRSGRSARVASIAKPTAADASPSTSIRASARKQASLKSRGRVLLTPSPAKSPKTPSSFGRKRKSRAAADEDDRVGEEGRSEQAGHIGRVSDEARNGGSNPRGITSSAGRAPQASKRHKSNNTTTDTPKIRSRQRWTSPDPLAMRFFAAAVRSPTDVAKRSAAGHHSDDSEDDDSQQEGLGEDERDDEMEVDLDERSVPRPSRVRSSKRVQAKPTAKQGPTRAKGKRSAAPRGDASGFVAFADEDNDFYEEVPEDSGINHAAADEDSSEGDDNSSEVDGKEGEETEEGVEDEEAIASTSRRFTRASKKLASNGITRLRSGTTAPLATQSVAELMGSGPAAEIAAKRLPAVPYSRFTPIAGGADANYLVDMTDERPEAISFGMKQGESLSFVGIAKVTVVKGKLRVGAATLSDDGVTSIEVFAPIGYPVPSLVALEGSTSNNKESSVDGLDVAAFPVIVRLQELQHDIQHIGKVCPIAGLKPFALPGRMRNATNFPYTSTFELLFAPTSTGSTSAWTTSSNATLTSLEVPEHWLRALQRLSIEVSSSDADLDEPTVALVRGPKKVGKSTFIRMALNELLTSLKAGTKVAMLDLDLGQSEFGPPGSVILHVFTADDLAHGPGWCSPRIASRAHFIGDTSPKDDPARYIQAVEEVVGWFKAEVQRDPVTRLSTPLLINTQGWVKGLGADLAQRIETIVLPTHVFDIVVPQDGDSVHSQTFRGEPYLDHQGAILAPGASVTKLSGASTAFVAAANPVALLASTGSNMVSSSNTRPSAADTRTLSIVSWFHATGLAGHRFALTGDIKSKARWDFSAPLLAKPPFSIDVQTGLKGGLHVLPFGSSVPDELKLHALNSSIVSIVSVPLAATGVEPASDPAQNPTSPDTVWRHAFSHPRPSATTGSTSLGLALVRSIDPTSGKIHLLTPLPGPLLRHAATEPNRALALVKGAIDLPVWLSLDFECVVQAREGKLTAHGTMAGVEKEAVPFLEWPKSEGEGENGTVVGSRTRKVRKNLMRRAQM